MAKINIVIAGDYEGKELKVIKKSVTINIGDFLNKQVITLDKKTVESYNVVDENYQKSAKNGALKGVVGFVLLGGIGALAGVHSAKNKGTHTLQINFRDGKKSLVLVDDKIKTTLMKILF